MDDITTLGWHVRYARKEQIKRLNEWLEENNTNSIGAFLNQSPAEWQLDSLIRYSAHYMPKIQEELKEARKPLWKKLLRK